MSRLGRGFPNNALRWQTIMVKPPVTYDATGAGATGHVTSLSWSHTIGAQAKAVIVAATMEGTGTATAKVGSTSMTQLAGPVGDYSGIGDYLVMFGLLNPPTGAQTVSITFGGTDYAAANSVSYLNVSSFGSPVTATGNSASLAVTATSASGQMVAQAFAGLQSTISSYNQTSRYNAPYASGVHQPLLIGDAPGASTVNFTASQTSNPWAAAAVPLKP